LEWEWWEEWEWEWVMGCGREGVDELDEGKAVGVKAGEGECERE